MVLFKHTVESTYKKLEFKLFDTFIVKLDLSESSTNFN